MSAMIERVAKAIHGNGYDKCWEVIKDADRRDARAAIAAMRDPIIAAIEAERLSDKSEDSGDIAYNNAISHARNGIEELINAALAHESATSIPANETETK